MSNVTAARRPFTWNAVLWSLVYPQRVHRVVPTIPGVVLVSLSIGIGLAAYNSSSNILFLTLSLLLASLVLSGVLSWLNLKRVSWRVVVPSVLRVGHDAMVGLHVRNRKTFLPTYGLRFTFFARSRRPDAEQRPESTLTARGEAVRAALARAAAGEIRGQVALPGRLEPQSVVQLDWVFRPTRRGCVRLELASVGSMFPFGFLRKDVGITDATDVVVWPATIDYQRLNRHRATRQNGDQRVARAGSGSDLFAVRPYQPGDSHRLIHWKASARTRQLLVRQFADETASGYHVWLEADRARWPREEQFELLVSLAATLCEDLFRAGRLLSVSIGAGAEIPVRRVHDLETVLNRLAVLEPTANDPAATRNGGGLGNVLRFAPDGSRGVVALVNGERLVSA